jgi:phage baseplate assembly protein gpV
MNGSYPITKVVHSIRFGVWKTTVGVGNNAIPLESAKMIERFCSNELTDIQSATALKWEKDPESLGRIPVKVLGFSTNKYWAYPAQVSAGAKQSSFILPEEGEQLMIGFMHGTYNQGVVLTSIYSGSKKPPSPFKLDAKTPFGVVSKAGLKLIFDDDKKSIESSSSSSNKILIEEKSGIELKSKKDLKTSSSAKTDIKASATIKIKGTTIDLN